MAKRFTDTNKWDHSWFRKLPSKMKVAWFYILDKCDHAGVWTSDFEAMSFNIGEEIKKEEFEFVFAEKISIINDKYLINSFVDYQYGTLNPSNRVHQSVINRLEKVSPSKGLKSIIYDAKDKDKSKDKDKDKDKEQEKDKDKDKENSLKNKIIKNAYSEAYVLRYGIEPATKNASFNSMVSKLREKLGVDEAVEVVRFYLTHNDGFYIKATHSFNLCLRDADTLRTQMLKGKAITMNDVRRFEKSLEQKKIIDDANNGGF